ncbi:lysophospholipid acyltransferase family protein [Lysobacter sp. KIS68-7]|uniref:GNAT family N-acyltransferase n=1 Tax=Lysobacter sp. KIS68-7 TaxID=2904252 RepID=UPI001E657E67|nr:GNAT family N-acyltransferase [Lysobacter sp. KIS68-7]UHQ21160.1 lysophospholipid acyltransferase family protein [Lysobacter sp. KIS68-7]
MPGIEHRLAERMPRLFRGRRARFTLPLLRTLAKWSRLDQVDAFLRNHSSLRGLAFVRAALDYLQADYHVAPTDLARIPARGGLVIVANHPSGALDALALLDAVGRVRKDVRIVANDVLMELEPLAELLLPVRVFGGRSPSESVRAIEEAVRAGQCVILFPAGEVSRFGPGGVRDGRWRRGFLRFARACDAPVLPVRIFARNSALFYGASTVFKPAGTALLAREMFERRKRRIALRVGEPMQLQAAADAQEVRRVRTALYALKPTPGAPRPLAAPVDPALVERAIAGMECLGETADGKKICTGRLPIDSPVLRELGRLRERTFRAVGEGTGRAVDLDVHDGWYEHIVLWDAPERRIVGAYRVARGARVLAEHGLRGLYTASLFDYPDAMLPRIAEGLELGRSFVVPEAWGSRSIDWLWQGIGAYLRRHPRVRYLFGAVSISAALPVAAREQIVAFYTRFHGGPDAEVISRRPFAYRAAAPEFADIDADTAFRVLKDNLDGLGATVPMLYKQYTELCEPGGARFLAFGVDPDFGDSVDGLIEVDIQRMAPRKRRRYLAGPPQ